MDTKQSEALEKMVEGRPEVVLNEVSIEEVSVVESRLHPTQRQTLEDFLPLSLGVKQFN